LDWLNLKKFTSTNNKPWKEAYPIGVDWDEEIPVKPLFTFIDDSVKKFGDNPCIDFLGKKYTYREIGDLVSRAAKGFQQLGVKKGTKVGLCLPNSTYFLICYYGILKAGGAVVNFNPLYVKRELSYQIEDSETEVMVTLDLKQIYPKIATLLEEGKLRRVVICQMSDILPAVKSLLFSVLKRSEIAAIPDDT
jgi:long-chain acyl-CoA synthetase